MVTRSSLLRRIAALAALAPRLVRLAHHDYSDRLLAVPELPEVETVVRCLAPELVGRRVMGVSVRETRLRGGVAPDFAERLTGRRIEGLARRGKYLLAALDDGRLWLVHLGMTGRLTLAPPGRADERHDHVVVRLDDGRVLTFNDARRVGLGRPGWFQLHHRVYDRAGEPCRRCAEPIRARVIVGRSSFYCPRCQV